MILVDTSVWIDFFAGRDLPHVVRLEQFLAKEEDLCLCGLVLTEILQGISQDTAYRRVRRYLRPLLMLPMPESVFLRAADIYRNLRKSGVTIRKTNDCVIAATALEYRCRLLHNDKDFSLIAGEFPLRIAATGNS